MNWGDKSLSMHWETGSASSETNNSEYSEKRSASILAFGKRLARPFKTEGSAEDIDNGMKNLYQDPDILEQKCSMAAKLEVISPVEKSAVASTKEMERIVRQGYSNKTAQSVIASLPEGFFTLGYDPVAQIPGEIALWGDGDLTQQFMLKIEDVDTDKDMILSSLSDLIEANYSELMGCMRAVYDIDLDLSRAGMQVVFCRRKISQASESLMAGAMQIAVLAKKRERLVLVATMAKSLKSLMDVHRNMLNDVNIGK